MRAMSLDKPPAGKRRQRAGNDQLLDEISAFCRASGMAESTFGRRAVNDGKFVARLRFGGRVTTQTAERVRSFIARNAHESAAADAASQPAASALAVTSIDEYAEAATTSTHFRFYDNRQKYLLFVSTCTEKWIIAQRV